jgi:predicted nuclease with TOPRIM domain
LQRFFEEDITSDFQTKIDDKDNKFNELRERGENYEEMLKLGDEVSELQSMLDSYEENRDRVKGEYVNLMHAGKMGGDSAEVDGKIHVLYKEFRMIRNQLLSQLPIIARKRELFQCLDRADLVIL